MANLHEAMLSVLESDIEIVKGKETGQKPPKKNEVIKDVVDPELGYADDVENVDALTAGKSYVGKKVIFCNSCLNPSFLDSDITEETVCPVCGADNTNLEAVGVVALDDSDYEDENGEGVKVESGNDSYEFNEQNMNKLSTEFLRAVYENARRFVCESATYTKDGQLRVRGTVKFNSGNTRTLEFLTDKFKMEEGKQLSVKATCSALSKSKGFVFEGRFSNKILSLEGMQYHYFTRLNNEAYAVKGKVGIKEGVVCNKVAPLKKTTDTKISEKAPAMSARSARPPIRVPAKALGRVPLNKNKK